MNTDYKWLETKTPRAVDQLRLWADNPRLNPEEDHINLHHFIEDFTSDTEKTHFVKLVQSIANNGFIPADPIVIWKNEDNQKHYVAEGNRRVAALKLLRHPDKSPKNIRSVIRQCANKIKASDIEKIYVNVAPSFDAAEWYINQRNSTTSLNRPWTREQQQRWIAELHAKYDGNIETIKSKTNLTQGDLEGTIRLLKIKDFVKLPSVKSKLTAEEFDKASSYRFPMTILERFLSISEAREKWGIEYQGIEVNITSNKESFYNAFAHLVKKIINGEINTRFTKDDLPEILKGLPSVSFENTGNKVIEPSPKDSPSNEPSSDKDTIHGPKPISKNVRNVRGNKNRKNLIPDNCKLDTTNSKLEYLFGELGSLAFTRKYSISVVLRVFFDLAVLEYIDSEGIASNIENNYFGKKLKHITLKQKLEYIKRNNDFNNDVKKVLNKLLNSQNDHYSLDTLNHYIHGKDTHYVIKEFLNGFWDFLYPLLQKLLDIKEQKNKL